MDNSQTRQIGGTGLGLYLVKQRVEAMGGRVWVESSFGDGSTFFVSLPRLSAADYQRRLLAYQNEQAAQNMRGAAGVVPVMPTVSTATVMPQVAPVQPVAHASPITNTDSAISGVPTAGMPNTMMLQNTTNETEERSVKITREKPTAATQVQKLVNPAASQVPAESAAPTMMTNSTPTEVTSAPTVEQPPIPSHSFPTTDQQQTINPQGVS